MKWTAAYRVDIRVYLGILIVDSIQFGIIIRIKEFEIDAINPCKLWYSNMVANHKRCEMTF